MKLENWGWCKFMWGPISWNSTLSLINLSPNNPNNWTTITYSCWDIWTIWTKKIIKSLPKKIQNIDSNSIGVKGVGWLHDLDEHGI
jgi:hypothetical protein